MVEKRVLIATLLSVLFLSVYSRQLAKRYPALHQTKAVPKTVSVVDTQTAPTQAKLLEHEETATIESSSLVFEIGKQTGNLHSVVLRHFKSNAAGEAIRFSHNFPIFSVTPSSESASVSRFTAQGNSAAIDFTTQGGAAYRVMYELSEQNPMATVTVQTPASAKPFTGDFVITTSWLRGDDLSNRQNRLESFAVVQPDKDKRKYSHTVFPLRKEKIVPRGTFLFSLSERYFVQTVRLNKAAEEGVILTSHEGSALARLSVGSAQADTPLAFVYFGPRDYFQMRKAGFAEALPIGMLGQIGLMLLLVLSWLASITHNYGIAVILFSVLITCTMAPFTLIGFRSMKKMQALKPKIDKIMADNKNNPTKANQEVLALYREHKISPLGGCLPMLLQMPIFIALFQAISHFIDLRGQTFLWIKDLSLPDHVFHLSFSLPILGDYLNALPAIMALAMYLQTRASQRMSGTSNDPTTQMMSGPMMPILFFVMFYHFPSGLVLYWLTNSLSSMVWYRLAK